MNDCVYLEAKNSNLKMFSIEKHRDNSLVSAKSYKEEMNTTLEYNGKYNTYDRIIPDDLINSYLDKVYYLARDKEEILSSPDPIFCSSDESEIDDLYLHCDNVDYNDREFFFHKFDDSNLSVIAKLKIPASSNYEEFITLCKKYGKAILLNKAGSRNDTYHSQQRLTKLTDNKYARNFRGISSKEDGVLLRQLGVGYNSMLHTIGYYNPDSCGKIYTSSEKREKNKKKREEVKKAGKSAYKFTISGLQRITTTVARTYFESIYIANVYTVSLNFPKVTIETTSYDHESHSWKVIRLTKEEVAKKKLEQREKTFDIFEDILSKMNDELIVKSISKFPFIEGHEHEYSYYFQEIENLDAVCGKRPNVIAFFKKAKELSKVTK